MTRVLVVEDDVQIVRALRINFKARGYQVDTAPDGQAASWSPTRPRYLITEPGMGYRFEP